MRNKGLLEAAKCRTGYCLLSAGYSHHTPKYLLLLNISKVLGVDSRLWSLSKDNRVSYGTPRNEGSY